MSVQTSFPTSMTAAFAGLKGDVGPDYVRSYVNGSGSGLPFGVMCKPKSGAEASTLDEYSAGASPLGVTCHTHAYLQSALSGSDGIGDGDMANVMRQGSVWVTAEAAVTAGTQAYARHTSDGGSNTQKGTFRGDRDGTAQVDTFTPTAANSTLYSVNVMVDGKLFHFEVTSDGSGTATEICDAFRTAMAADTAFSAYVTGSGTSTLILTAVTAGLPFYAASGGSAGVMALAHTTANATKADPVPGCKWLTSTSGAGLALLEVNFPQ